MKFFPTIVLPCFLILGATPFVSQSTMGTNVSSESTSETIVSNAYGPSGTTARRGSGRRQVMAQTAIEQVAL